MPDFLLVTGGCGFIGANLVPKLLAEGARVRVLDNMSQGSVANLEGVEVEVMEGDIRDQDVVARALDGVDEAQYRAAAQDLPRVKFAGFVQACDLPGYYALADVLVFPTLGDPHGLVVEEGMAAGLPVIATEAAGDIRQRLPDGRAGYVVPPADVTQLAARMLRLAGDPALRTRFSSEAPRLVAGRTHERWASDFEAFVDRVLSMPPRRTPASLVARAVGLSALAAGAKNGGSPSPTVGLWMEGAHD